MVLIDNSLGILHNARPARSLQLSLDLNGLANLGPMTGRNTRSHARMNRSTTLGVLLALLAVMSAVALVACGGGEPAPPSSPPADTPVPPAATPIPPTSIPDEGDLPFEFTEYVDSSGVFSIDYPADWTVDDRSRADTISIFWYPEEMYASASLFLTQLTGVADPAGQIKSLIDEWMIDASAFATDPDYEELSREDQADGSVLLRFYYAREDEPAQAGCFFEVQESLFSALCLSGSEERWEELADVLDHMAYSLVTTPPTAGGEASTYTEYTHPSGVFDIEYPEGWTVEDLSTEGQTIFLSFSGETDGFIFAQLVDAGEVLSAEGLNDFANGILGSGFGQAPSFQEVSRQAQPDGSLMVLFTYLADGELMNAGTLFGQKGTLVSLLTVGAPAQLFDSLTPDFDHAVYSYTLDETAWPY
jgi:hypothetical protein